MLHLKLATKAITDVFSATASEVQEKFAILQNNSSTKVYIGVITWLMTAIRQ